ncbi:MAG: restriction endonuclease subunit S [Alphaproteobacteria bacterium]|nr:MAG: restriction endonuclease subunit S [Alphaproteobacteria bacterium]
MTVWSKCTIGDVLTLQRGFDITKATQRDGSIPVVSSSGINSFHDEAKVSGPGVVIGRKGTLGTCFYLPGPYWPHDTALWVKDFKGNDPKFCYYFLQAMDLAVHDVGAANPTLNRNHVHLLPAVRPPLDTQRRIAAILGAYDDLIEVNRRRVAVLEEMARSLFDEWFVRFRFPGHESVPMIDTPNGPLPQGWSMAAMADVAHVNRASLRPKASPDRIGYIDIASVSPGRIDAVTDMAFEDAPGRARRVVKDGSILWSNVRPNRRSHALVLSPDDNTIASTGFTVLDAHALPFSFLYQWVTTEDFVGYLVGNATGSAYPAVTATTFERANVLVPTSDAADRYADFAEPLLRQGYALLAANERLAASRDLLLPRLISGQLSVERAEKELEMAA